MPILFEDKLRHSNEFAALADSRSIKGGFLGTFANAAALADEFDGGAQDPNTLTDMALVNGSTAYLTSEGVFVVLTNAANANIDYGQPSTGWTNFATFIGATTGASAALEALPDAAAGNHGLVVGTASSGSILTIAVDYGQAATPTTNLVLDATDDTSSSINAGSGLASYNFLYDDGSGTVKYNTGANLFGWIGSGLTVNNDATPSTGATHLTFNSAGSGLTTVEGTAGQYTITADVASIIAGTGVGVSSTSGAFTITADISNIIDGKGTKVTTQGTDTIVNLNYQTGATNFIATHQTTPTATQAAGMLGQNLAGYQLLVNDASNNSVIKVDLDDFGFHKNFNESHAASSGITIDETDFNDIQIALEHGTNSFIRRVPTATNQATTVADLGNTNTWLALHSDTDGGAVKINFSELPYIENIPATQISTTTRRVLALLSVPDNTNSVNLDELEYDQPDLYYEQDANGEGTLFADNLILENNLTVKGDVLQYNSTVVTFEDSILELNVPRDQTTGDLTDATTNTGKYGLDFVMDITSQAVTSKAEFYYNATTDRFEFRRVAEFDAATGADNVAALKFNKVISNAANAVNSANGTSEKSLCAISKNTITIDSAGPDAAGNTAYRVYHNLGTQDVIVHCIKTQTSAGTPPAGGPFQVFVSMAASTVDYVDVVLGTTAAGEEYKVVVIA